MEPLTVYRDYKQLRAELKTELHKAAGSFCRIGFLLKQAKDTDVLKETPYADVYAFASSEFGLDKTQVSRFININNRFSINGNSEQLLPEYAEYGVAKLSLMLTLPDEINEELSPEYSKSDIQAIKEEYDAEQKITPLEVMAEPPAEQPETDKDEFLTLIVKQLNDEHPTPITLIHQIREKGPLSCDDLIDAYRPDGDKVYIIRVSGQGRFTVTMKADGVSIVNARTFEKSVVNWDDWMDFVLDDEEGREYKPEVIHEASKKKVEKSSASKNVSKQPENALKTDKMSDTDEKTIVQGIEKVEGEVIDPPEIEKNTLPEPVEQCQDNVPQETAGAAGEDGSAEAAGEEDMLIDTLEMMLSPTECYRIREMVKEMDSIHGYREKLDHVSEWIAQLYTVSGKLYAKLASRGM